MLAALFNSFEGKANALPTLSSLFLGSRTAYIWSISAFQPFSLRIVLRCLTKSILRRLAFRSLVSTLKSRFKILNCCTQNIQSMLGNSRLEEGLDHAFDGSSFELFLPPLVETGLLCS